MFKGSDYIEKNKRIQQNVTVQQRTVVSVGPCMVISCKNMLFLLFEDAEMSPTV
jgi:hypothetical protein